MNSPLAPLTELEAANTMLSVIGEAPVSTLEDSGLVDVVTALRILRQVSLEVQGMVWHWNTEKNYRLTPSYPEGHLLVPANTLRVDPVDSVQGLDLVQRGARMWDRRNHTDKFDQPVTVDLVLALSFDMLPAAARNYITIRAARIFQDRVLGSETLSAFAERDEIQALNILQEYETDTADYNMLGEWSVARVLAR
jgi:hypothetical protein